MPGEPPVEQGDAIRSLAALVTAVLDTDLPTVRAIGENLTAQLAVNCPGARGIEGALRAELRFDPVGLAEIAAMTGETAQLINYLMGTPGAPAPVRLARMKVWRRSEFVVWWSSIGREVSWTDAPMGEDKQ